MSKPESIKLDVISLMEDLLSFGYKHCPLPRSAGSAYRMVSPDGRIILEKDFQIEIDALLLKEHVNCTDGMCMYSRCYGDMNEED